MYFKEANAAYISGDYGRALELYKKTGEVLGESFVKDSIRRCNKRIAEGFQPEQSNDTQTEQESDFVFKQCSQLPSLLVRPALNNCNRAEFLRVHSKSDSITRSRLDPATEYLLILDVDTNDADNQRKHALKKYREKISKTSAHAQVKKINPIPDDWPKDLVLAELPHGPNDYEWNRRRKGKKNSTTGTLGLSIIVPTFNRSKILDVTLACLTNQKTSYPFEVIVSDDGSKESIESVVRPYEKILDIKYVRQKDYGYQLCAVRNLGLRTSKYPFVAILDCDMAPGQNWVDTYVNLLIHDDDTAYIGPRKYIDTTGLAAEEFIANPALLENLPEIRTNNSVAGKTDGQISVDWRLQHFKETEDLRLCTSPFRYFSGGNVAFSRKWLDRAGWFDEEFNHWGGEDNEFGYRLFRQGCFFSVAWGAMAYHQEPPGKENETDRDEGKKVTIELVKNKVPYFYRGIKKLEDSRIFDKPLVSIYIPAYNCANTIVRCVESALNQTIVDLEVCICDDGSTDNTLDVLVDNFIENPRVRIFSKKNGGIGSASNVAVHGANGFYIGQLDSDDYLNPDAVEICLKEFLSSNNLVCVYASNRNVDLDGNLIAEGYNWPEFSREKFATAMIVHHFRMFTVRGWNLVGGFDEEIVNAVDYDFYLKLSEVGSFRHVNRICYNRVLHGENTSIRKIDVQKLNHFKVVNDFFLRQTNGRYKYVAVDDEPTSRRYKFVESQMT